MGDRRSNKVENFCGSSQGRSRYRRPPHPAGCEEASVVPSWEKKFCYCTCSIPWGRLLEMKKLISYYPNVVQWDDSAGEEAFQNAKARFWAELNHLPCHIPPPDPDIYLGDIDWNCHIDPNLVSDLEEPLPPINDDVILGLQSVAKNNQSWCGWGDAEVSVRPSGWGNAAVPEKPSGWGDTEAHYNKPTGWGEAEAPKNRPTGWEEAKAYKDKPTGWESAEIVLSNRWDASQRALENCENNVVGSERWNCQVANQNTNKNGWNGDGWNCKDDNKNNNQDGWNHGRWTCKVDNKNNNQDGWNRGGWNNGCEDNSSGWQQWGGENYMENVESRKNGHSWDARDWSSRRGANHRFSRYKVSRYQDMGDDYQFNNSGRRNGGSRKRGSVFERPEAVKQRQLTSRPWDSIPFCRPGNLNIQGATDAWGWEKPVS